MKFSLPPLRVDQPASAFAEGNTRWTNKDLDPVPRNKRKWGVVSFIAYWISDAFNAATWEFASSIIAIGLTWRESLGVVAIGFFIISFVISFNGATGVLYHAPFPVLSRASWGFWGSYVAIISRCILAIFWFAIQTMNGANCFRVMIGAICGLLLLLLYQETMSTVGANLRPGPSFLRLHNSIPKDQGITTNQMVSFFLFWLAQVPFLVMHPNKLRWLFMAKSIIVPICFIAILIWAFTTTSGGSIFDQHTSIHGSAYSWAWLSSLTSVIGNYATLSVNQADFSRYSRVSVKWQLLYVPMLPIVFTFISFIGIAASSAGAAKYGVLQWDPMALVAEWDNRACRFFAAFSFSLAALGVNISANSLSAANDLMSLSPTYINIRRGQLICALFSWALVPWKILESAGSFLNFMSAYAVFLGPIAGIMLVDFWILHRRRYDVRDLYTYGGRYHYWNGINFRAWIAFIVAITPTLPGLAQTVTPNSVNVGVGVHPFQIGWFLSITVGCGIYLALSYALPARETFIDRAVRPDDVYDEMKQRDGGVIEGVDAGVEGEEKGYRGVDTVGGEREKIGWKEKVYRMI